MTESDHALPHGYQLELENVLEMQGMTRAELDQLATSPRFRKAMQEEFGRQLVREQYEQRIQKNVMTPVLSSAMYPEGWMLGSWEEQAQRLAEQFPGLDVSYVDMFAEQFAYRSRLDEGFIPDGIGLIPKPSALMRLKPETGHSDWPAYHRVSAWLLAEMKRHGARWTGGLTLADNLDLILHHFLPETLILRPETQDAYAQQKTLPGDVMLFDLQTGLLHRGESVPLVRSGFQRTHEFGLCPYAVLMILITNPGRFTKAEDLGIDCAGADWQPTKGAFSPKDVCPSTLSWHVHEKKLVLGAYSGIGAPRAGFGSATGKRAPSR